MAQYNGYVPVAHVTYQAFRNATLGNGYNVDYEFGNQCWDFCALLWWQYGLTLYTGTNGIAEECLTQSRERNAVTPFTSFTGVENILRGDVCVFAGTSSYPTGHIAFADEDYQSGENTMRFLGQNQGQGTSAPSNLAVLPITNIIGIFRNTYWNASPPTPPTPTADDKKHKFPWAIALQNWF